MTSAYDLRPLGDVIQQETASVEVNPDDQYPIVGIYSYGRGFIRRPVIQGSETSYRRMTALKTGQLVMSKLNAWEGALAVVSEEFAGGFVSPEYPVFNIDDEQADPSYLAYLVQWSNIWDRLTPRGSMVRRKRTNPSTLMTLNVPLPALTEQRRVATILKSTFRRLEDAADSRAKLDTTYTRLSNALFAGPMRPLSEFLSPCADWVRVEHEQVYQTAGIYSHGRGMFARPPVRGDDVTYARYNRIRSAQFIYSRLFGWEGALAVVPPHFDEFFVSNEFPTFEIDTTQAIVEYVDHLTRWHGLRDQLQAGATGLGSRRQRVKADKLLSAMVPLPSVGEQERLAGCLNRLDQARRLATHQTNVLGALRSSVLNAAFTGEL